MSRIARAALAALLVIAVVIFAADGNRVSMPPTRADQPTITQIS